MGGGGRFGVYDIPFESSAKCALNNGKGMVIAFVVLEILA